MWPALGAPARTDSSACSMWVLPMMRPTTRRRWRLSPMNRYGRVALEYTRDHLPRAFAEIEDPEVFFTDAGAEIETEIGQMREQLRGARRPGETQDEHRLRSSHSSRMRRSWCWRTTTSSRRRQMPVAVPDTPPVVPRSPAGVCRRQRGHASAPDAVTRAADPYRSARRPTAGRAYPSRAAAYGACTPATPTAGSPDSRRQGREGKVRRGRPRNSAR